MLCSDNTCLAKIALAVMIASFVCSTVAIFTPYWNQQDTTDSKTEYTGLIVQCNNTLSVCSNIGDILDKYKDSSYYTSQLTSLSLAMVGWVFGIVAVVLLVVYVCCTIKCTAIPALLFCLLSGACITAAVIVYGVGFEDLVNSTLGWSFALDAAAGFLALIAGILVIVNTCLLP